MDFKNKGKILVVRFFLLPEKIVIVPFPISILEKNSACSRPSPVNRRLINFSQPNSSQNLDHYTENFSKLSRKFENNMYTTEKTKAIAPTRWFYSLYAEIYQTTLRFCLQRKFEKTPGISFLMFVTVKFFGHEIAFNTIETIQSKTSTIQKVPSATTKTELMKFVGSINIYSRIIENFSCYFKTSVYFTS